MRTPAVAGALIICLSVSSAATHAQWLNYKTPGMPRLPNGTIDLYAPAPRSANDKPDFTGLCRAQLSTRESAKLHARAEAVAKSRMEDLRRDSPEALCLPGPIANIGVGKIVQTPSLLLMLYGGTLYREIFLDGRALPSDPNPDWVGYSVGRW